MSHPEFYSAAKQNGYVPPNKEVLVYWCLFGHSFVILKFSIHLAKYLSFVF